MPKKVAGGNYFVALIILLIIAVILFVTGLALIATFPGSLGSPPSQKDMKEAYQFEPWFFKICDVEADFSQGGIIVPIYQEDKQKAALILGQGDYKIQGQRIRNDDISGLYIFITGDRFEELRGDIIFMPVEDEHLQHKFRDVFESQPGLPSIWERGIPLEFCPGEESSGYYFLGPDRVSPHHFKMVEPAKNIWATAGIYTIFVAVVIIILLIFSLDHTPSRYYRSLCGTSPPWAAAFGVLIALLCALAGELLPHWTGSSAYMLVVGYLAAGGILVLMHSFKIIDSLDFGFRIETANNGYLMTAVAAFLFIVLAGCLPGNLSFHGLESILEYLKILFFIALVREAIWRGYIQTTLSRYFSPYAGLALTVLLTTFLHYLLLNLVSPWIFSYPYTIVETAVLVPGTALILGLLYLRTENILCPTLLHSIILFIPTITGS